MKTRVMLAPEMAVPKPPPAPGQEPLQQKKPEKKVRTDKPREEEALKKIAKPDRRLEPPPKKALVKQQRRAEPLPDQKLKVSQQKRKNPDDSPRLQVDSKKRTGGPSTGGFKVRAARRGDAPADIPAAFATTRKRADVEIEPAKLSSVGVEPRRKAPETDEAQQLKVRSVQRAGPLEGEAKHGDMARSDKAPVNMRAEEDLRGFWQKIENIGPLAQLNALCYGRRSGEVVYQDRYRLKCSNNQIIEAWRKKSGK